MLIVALYFLHFFQKPCEWKCKHSKCTRKCGDFCNRQPCNKPCELKLPCGHDCIGFCGEPCPPQCRFCNPEITERKFGFENAPDARFVFSCTLVSWLCPLIRLLLNLGKCNELFFAFADSFWWSTAIMLSNRELWTNISQPLPKMAKLHSEGVRFVERQLRKPCGTWILLRVRTDKSPRWKRRITRTCDLSTWRKCFSSGGCYLLNVQVGLWLSTFIVWNIDSRDRIFGVEKSKFGAKLGKFGFIGQKYLKIQILH